jgi:hypothetical protein
MQPIVHERIDHDHAGTGRNPALPVRIGGQQQLGDCQRHDLAGDPVDAAKRLEQRVPHSRCAIWRSRLISGRKPIIDPADEVTMADVSNEEEQRVGCLIQATITQVMAWQRAAADEARLGAGVRALREPAVLKMPVALKARAGGRCAQGIREIAEAHSPMFVHVSQRDCVSDTLVIHHLHEPVEQCRGIVTTNRGSHAVPGRLRLRFGNKRWRYRKARDGFDMFDKFSHPAARWS